MIINMVGGGGGAALNFKVVPGLTQPGTASENTIWVKTERIGAWYFSATQPEGLQEWDVWFQIGTESVVEFNALKKNGLQVYPLNAKQYVNGALVDKTAMSYQNGKWEEWWTGQLFTNGKQWEKVTGGWTSEGYKYTHSTGYTQVDAEIGDTIKVSVDPGNQANGWQCSIAGTKNLIDLTEVSVIKCRASDVNTAFLCVHKSKTYADLSAITRASLADGVTTLDVSGHDYAYVFLHVHCGGDVRKATVPEIWME